MADIVTLLETAIDDRTTQEPGTKVLLRTDVHDVACSIMELTSGVKGLSGFCLSELWNSQVDFSTKEQWQLHCSKGLIDSLMGTATFKRITDILYTVFPSYEYEERLLQTGGVAWDEHKLKQRVLHEVVYQGACIVKVGELGPIMELIAEGLLVIGSTTQDEQGNIRQSVNSLNLMISSNPNTELDITLAAPILGTCLMNRLSMATQNIASPPDGELDTWWLLQQVRFYAGATHAPASRASGTYCGSCWRAEISNEQWTILLAASWRWWYYM